MELCVCNPLWLKLFAEIDTTDSMLMLTAVFPSFSYVNETAWWVVPVLATTNRI